MKITIVLETPNPHTEQDEENVLEEFELDIVDDIQCGKTSGKIGNRGTYGTWSIKII
jgi:hypothetical protein